MSAEEKHLLDQSGKPRSPVVISQRTRVLLLLGAAVVGVLLVGIGLAAGILTGKKLVSGRCVCTLCLHIDQPKVAAVKTPPLVTLQGVLEY